MKFLRWFLLVLGVVALCVIITPRFEAATLGTLGRLPTSSGGVFSQDNLDQINTNVTTANSNFTTIASNINSSTVTLTLSQLQTLHSVPVQLIAAQGAGTVVVPTACSFNLIGTVAFAGGGAVTIGYGTSASPNAMGTTIAAAVFTGLSANTYQGLVGAAQAAAASSGYLNTGIYAVAASADFTLGTGSTGIFSCTYKVVSGLS